MTKTTTKLSNSQLVKQIEYLLKEKTDAEDVLTNVDDLDNHPTLDFTEMIWYDKMIGTYPTEECIKQMERVFKLGGSVEDVCKYVGISYKTYKNWMNPKRKFNNTYTKYLQQTMIRRLRRAKVEFKLFCNSTLMELAKTNFRALMLLYDKALAAEKEEKERYNSEGIGTMKPRKDYSMENDKEFF